MYDTNEENSERNHELKYCEETNQKHTYPQTNMVGHHPTTGNQTTLATHQHSLHIRDTVTYPQDNEYETLR